MPVAQLSSSVFSELSTYMARLVDGTFRNNVSIHYRRLEIRPVSIPNGNRDYYTKSLLSDSDNPCKIVICFVESTAKAGSYINNPFEFRRSWEVTVPDPSSSVESRGSDENSQLCLNEKLTGIEFRLANQLQQQLHNQFKDFAAELLSSTQKLLATSLNAAVAVPHQNVDEAQESLAAAQERLKSFIATTEANEPAAEPTLKDCSNVPNPISDEQEDLELRPTLRNLRSGQQLQPPRDGSTTSSTRSPSRGSEYFSFPKDDPKPKPTIKVTQFIQNISCTLNSTPIDQVFFI